MQENSFMNKSAELKISAIEKQIAALQQKQKDLMSKNNAKVLNQIVSLATKNGISATDIAAALKSQKPARKSTPAKIGTRAAVAPKYRNPANAAETWSGRGRTPLWVKALMDAGTLDSAIIK
jgi:DNA-binding protein H-NS